MWKINYEKIHNYKSEYIHFLKLDSRKNNNNLVKLQAKWEELRNQIIKDKKDSNKITQHPELYEEKVEDFLVMDFSKLFKVYLDFIKLIPEDDYYKIIHKLGANGKKISKDNPAIKNSLFEAAEKVFNYNHYTIHRDTCLWYHRRHACLHPNLFERQEEPFYTVEHPGRHARCLL